MFVNSDISSGWIFCIPKFCTNNKDNPKCKKFYSSLTQRSGFHTCPYGFSVECTNLGDIDIIYTCLNIDKKTDRKISRKYKDVDQKLRLSLNEYNRLKSSFESFISANKPAFDIAASHDKESTQLKLNRELLENTMHELRKLNTQLKGYVTKLTTCIQQMSSRDELIDVCNLNIYSVSSLISIRLDTYDLEINPTLNLDLDKKNIAIYKKVEKAYKCLNLEAKQKGITITLEGKSYNLFNSNNLIEIAFFIVLENAIKYSPEGEQILIKFNEIEDQLTLTFRNWGLRPGDDEINKLTNRYYRSRNIINRNMENGRGIGLYLLNQICSINDIRMKIKLGSENKYLNGYRYSPFFVEMKFDGMLSVEII